MYGKFLVEGDKSVRELIESSFEIDFIYAIQDWSGSKESAIEVISETELLQISTHEKPNQVIAVAVIPIQQELPKLEEKLYLVCDSLSDPGNAGAIIRIADWFGIHTLFFSENSVDVYNPKVVSSAKGSLLRTNIYYVDLKKLFQENKQLNVFGTFMNGENIYEASLPESGFILLGNEANGISDELNPFLTKKLSIPAYGKAESLNAAVAAGIVVSEFKRRK